MRRCRLKTETTTSEYMLHTHQHPHTQTPTLTHTVQVRLQLRLTKNEYKHSWTLAATWPCSNRRDLARRRADLARRGAGDFFFWTGRITAEASAAVVLAATIIPHQIMPTGTGTSLPSNWKIPITWDLLFLAGCAASNLLATDSPSAVFRTATRRAKSQSAISLGWSTLLAEARNCCLRAWNPLAQTHENNK